MDIKLSQDDTFRIYADNKGNNFIDVLQFGYDAMAVDMFTNFQYIEIRKKHDIIRVFSFKKKSHKKECDFGWWEDAEVVFSINEQTVNK